MFTKNNGEIVTRQYLIERTRTSFSRWRSYYSIETRNRIMTETVKNDDWLNRLNGQTVGSVVRTAIDRLLDERFDHHTRGALK